MVKRLNVYMSTAWYSLTISYSIYILIRYISYTYVKRHEIKFQIYTVHLSLKYTYCVSDSLMVKKTLD